ncbi:hypothetical protein GPECTOR_6g468 [Gonium pectorale]|uniref:Pherophorin domain-containing protein n=1 Tax=Gonium pectorale TaxID=33097 RepID=A0A150GV27_GONPE|nr:hypothetical protein GPECTOR_6g468 [Gonium pectorale]|eukprot:KXZ53552.1 hypothetical protein GPECTOR_6g468 [Gonium pectorale]
MMQLATLLALGASSTVTCYAVDYVGCDQTLACCTAMLASLDKLTFETTPGCGTKQNVLQVTVNNRTHASWSPYQHDTGSGYGYELKIYNLGFSNATFPGSKICVTTRSPCAGPDDICYSAAVQGCRYSFADTSSTTYCPVCSVYSPTSPADACLFGRFSEGCAAIPELNPPPPPPTAAAGGLIRTHECVQSNVNVPYGVRNFVSSDTTDQQGSPATALCFTVAAQSCAATSYCCDMDFAKVEIPITAGCKTHLRRLSINGAPVSYSWGFYNDTFLTVKFNNLVTALPNPVGATLCVVVRPSECALPANLCYGGRCQINVFSSNNKCCPATVFGG